MIEILVRNVNNKWVYDSFIRKTDVPLSEQKEIINKYLENGLMTSITKQLKKEFDIMPERLLVECEVVGNDEFNVARIGIL